MYYLSFIRSENACSNNLQKSISAFLTAQNRQIITEAEKENFKKFILSEIEKLNVKNKRCTPVKVSWRTAHRLRPDDKDEHLEGIHFIGFVLYAATMKDEKPAAPPEEKKEVAAAPVQTTVNRSPFDV